MESKMELQQLKYFLAVGDNNSLQKAAALLGIGQPALSRNIRQLEEDLGVHLFYRNGRGVSLTEAGVQFRGAVAPLVHDLLQARLDLTAESETLSGVISFGMPPSIAAAIGARIVRVLLEKYPKVRLQIVEGFSGHINEWIVSKRVDMAVVSLARRSSSIRMDPLLEADLFLLVGRKVIREEDLPGETVSFSRLAGIPLVLPGRYHGLRREVDAAAQKCNLELDVIAEVDALAALKELVRDGVAATVLPHGALLAEMGDSHFLVRRIVEPELTMSFMIAYSLQRPITQAVREVGRIVKSEVRRAIVDGRIIGRT